jgi:hypothetical protein
MPAWEAIENLNEILHSVNPDQQSAESYREIYTEATGYIQTLYHGASDDIGSCVREIARLNQSIERLNQATGVPLHTGVIDLKFFYNIRRNLDSQNPNRQLCIFVVRLKVERNFYPEEWCLDHPDYEMEGNAQGSPVDYEGGEIAEDRNAGDRNAGDRNAGDRNAGDRNAGDRNAGDRNAEFENPEFENPEDRTAEFESAEDRNAEYENGRYGDEGYGNGRYGDEGHGDEGFGDAVNETTEYTTTEYTTTESDDEIVDLANQLRNVELDGPQPPRPSFAIENVFAQALTDFGVNLNRGIIGGWRRNGKVGYSAIWCQNIGNAWIARVESLERFTIPRTAPHLPDQYRAFEKDDDGEYKWNSGHILNFGAVAFRVESKYELDPLGPLRPSKDSWFPESYIQIEWNDHVITWESRDGLRHIVSAKHPHWADTLIYMLACQQDGDYQEALTGDRPHYEMGPNIRNTHWRNQNAIGNAYYAVPRARPNKNILRLLTEDVPEENIGYVDLDVNAFRNMAPANRDQDLPGNPNQLLVDYDDDQVANRDFRGQSQRPFNGSQPPFDNLNPRNFGGQSQLPFDDLNAQSSRGQSQPPFNGSQPPLGNSNTRNFRGQSQPLFNRSPLGDSNNQNFRGQSQPPFNGSQPPLGNSNTRNVRGQSQPLFNRSTLGDSNNQNFRGQSQPPFNGSQPPMGNSNARNFRGQSQPLFNRSRAPLGNSNTQNFRGQSQPPFHESHHPLGNSNRRNVRGQSQQLPRNGAQSQGVFRPFMSGALNNTRNIIRPRVRAAQRQHNEAIDGNSRLPQVGSPLLNEASIWESSRVRAPRSSAEPQHTEAVGGNSRLRQVPVASPAPISISSTPRRGTSRNASESRRNEAPGGYPGSAQALQNQPAPRTPGGVISQNETPRNGGFLSRLFGRTPADQSQTERVQNPPQNIAPSQILSRSQSTSRSQSQRRAPSQPPSLRRNTPSQSSPAPSQQPPSSRRNTPSQVQLPPSSRRNTPSQSQLDAQLQTPTTRAPSQEDEGRRGSERGNRRGRGRGRGSGGGRRGAPVEIDRTHLGLRNRPRQDYTM